MNPEESGSGPGFANIGPMEKSLVHIVYQMIASRSGMSVDCRMIDLDTLHVLAFVHHTKCIILSVIIDVMMSVSMILTIGH